MKSIFFCERPETVHHVYPQETIDALKAEAGLISENVFDLNHVKENPAFFAEKLPLPNVFPENTDGMLTLIPGQYDTDGFFICRMRRKA